MTEFLWFKKAKSTIIFSGYNRLSGAQLFHHCFWLLKITQLYRRIVYFYLLTICLFIFQKSYFKIIKYTKLACIVLPQLFRKIKFWISSIQFPHFVSHFLWQSSEPYYSRCSFRAYTSLRFITFSFYSSIKES